MKSAAPAAAERDFAGMLAAIERFLKAARRPHLLEPGEDLLPLSAGTYAIDLEAGRLTIQAWSDSRNLTRRIIGIAGERRGRLELIVERFARQEGRMFLLDLARPDSLDATRRGGRLVFRERFRRFLTRQFPVWKLAEISAEQDLEHSLSPGFPRALLSKGQSGVAAIAAAPDGMDPSSILSFGLIWLDYLRRREHRLTIERLVLLLPAGSEASTLHRIPYLDQARACCEIFAYSEEDFSKRLDPADRGNLQTRLDVFRQTGAPAQAWVDRLKHLPGVEFVTNNNATTSLRMQGMEFARTAGDELLFGLEKRAAAREWNLPEIAALASELSVLRRQPLGVLRQREPEEWLASQVRSQLNVVDAGLRASPVYSQAPASLGGQRGVIDLLAADHTGRLAVIELKASQDIHLPLQALDYWIQVKWHLDRDEFSARGYFQGIALRKDPPRLLLVSPSLEFHPTTETILQFLSGEVEVERVGVGANWRERLQVMFRLRGAERPM